MRGWWAAAVAAGVTIGAAVGAAQPPDAGKAADPLGTLLAEGKSAHAALRDYACTFTRQERVNGQLGPEQVAELKYRANPQSIAVRFARPDAYAGTAFSYVANKRNGMVKVRQAGAKGLDRFTLVPLDDPKVLAEHRHPATGYGVGAVLDRVAKVAATEKAMGSPVEVHPGEFQFAGKAVTRYEILARRPHAHRYAYRMMVYVDNATKLPVRWEAHDAPRPGTTTGDLLEAHSYTDLRGNVGLGEAAFE